MARAAQHSVEAHRGVPVYPVHYERKVLWMLGFKQIMDVIAHDAKSIEFEVELSDRNGQTFELIGLCPEQLMVLHFEPASPDLRTETIPA